MTEYIKREDVIKAIESLQSFLIYSEFVGKRGAMYSAYDIGKAIEMIPSADVVSREDYEGLELVCKNYEEALKDTVDELTMTEWISVKDRLPSQDGYYLVAYKLDVIPQRWHFNVYPFSLDLYKTDKFDFPRKKYKGKSGFYFYDSEYGNCENSRVTHWMPLPKPPKENADG